MTTLRTKLTVLLAAPLLVLVVVACVACSSAVRRSREAEALVRRIELSLAASRAGLQLSHERHLSMSALSVPQAVSLPQELAFQRGKTAAALDALRAAGGPGARLQRLAELDSVRTAVDLRRGSVTDVFETYARVMDPVLTRDRTAEAVDDAVLSGHLDAHHALTRAIQDAAYEQSLLASAFSAGNADQPTYDRLVEVVSSQTLWLDQFQRHATPGHKAAYQELATVPAMATAQRLRQAVLAAGPHGEVDQRELEVWSNAMGRKIDLLETLADDTAATVADEAERQQATAQRQRRLSVGSLLGALGLSVAVLLLLRRGVVQPLGRLVSAARDAANRTLPAAVELARREGGDAVRRVFAPLEVPRPRELGELALAFNSVQETTAQLAAAEATLKGNTDAVFLHFGRRTQSLVARQLGHIDELESRTDDPDTLADLFLLDHLATRLRRNAESLVVLAGDDSPRPWSRPVTVVNVVRAAVAEATDYSRVDVETIAQGSVLGACANDVSHLLAELIDNALAFSPSDSRVTITGERQADGRYLMTVTDSGPGMPPAQLAQANRRLARAPSPDAETTRQFGLFVVARLAQRHGIEVLLVPARPRGTQARVLLPASLMGGAGDPAGTTASPNGASSPASSVPSAGWRRARRHGEEQEGQGGREGPDGPQAHARRAREVAGHLAEWFSPWPPPTGAPPSPPPPPSRPPSAPGPIRPASPGPAGPPAPAGLATPAATASPSHPSAPPHPSPPSAVPAGSPHPVRGEPAAAGDPAAGRGSLLPPPTRRRPPPAPPGEPLASPVSVRVGRGATAPPLHRAVPTLPRRARPGP